MMASGPVVYMLAQIAPALREAAMTLKAPPFTVFRRVVFPLTLPGVVIGQVLVFLNVMADFATVQTIGGNKHRAAAEPGAACSTKARRSAPPSVVAVLLMLCMLVGVVVAMRVVDIRRLGSERDGRLRRHRPAAAAQPPAPLRPPRPLAPHRLGAGHADRRSSLPISGCRS